MYQTIFINQDIVEVEHDKLLTDNEVVDMNMD